MCDSTGQRRVMILAQTDARNEIEPSFFELLSKIRGVFPNNGVRVAAMLAGYRLDSAARALAASGADEVHIMDDERLGIFNPEYHIPACEAIVRAWDPDILLIGATPAGEDIAPALGQRLKTGVAAHCVDLLVGADGKFIQMVPAFGGKVIGEIFTPGGKPEIASVKPGMFAAVKQRPAECGIISLDPSPLDDVSPRIRLVESLPSESAKRAVDKAELVLCGGFGVSGTDAWEMLDKLADKLGGAVGCTRPALDAGMMDDEECMIGTSGKSVRPKVYIGFGVSGAAHHMCGVQDAGLIISVNNDPDADVFRYSDYKVVADAAGLLPELLTRSLQIH